MMDMGVTATFSCAPRIQLDSGLPVVLPMTEEDAMTMKLQSLLQALRGCLDERTRVSRSNPQDDSLL